MVAYFVLTAGVAQGGTLSITERQSQGQNDLFAGNGGAVSNHEMSADEASLTGPFTFSDSGMAQVTDADDFSDGDATSDGTIDTTDSVSLIGGGTLSITAVGSGTSSVMTISGPPSLATSRQRARTRVRFQVLGDDATFQLTGNFTPPADSPILGDAVRLRLHRPFTVNKKFDINTAGPVNESGTLLAGQTWEFQVHINDASSLATSNPANDSFSYNLTFTVISVPAPSAFVLATIGVSLVGVAALRRKRRR